MCARVEVHRTRSHTSALKQPRQYRPRMRFTVTKNSGPVPFERRTRAKRHGEAEHERRQSHLQHDSIQPLVASAPKSPSPSPSNQCQVEFRKVCSVAETAADSRSHKGHAFTHPGASKPTPPDELRSRQLSKLQCIAKV